MPKPTTGSTCAWSAAQALHETAMVWADHMHIAVCAGSIETAVCCSGMSCIKLVKTSECLCLDLVVATHDGTAHASLTIPAPRSAAKPGDVIISWPLTPIWTPIGLHSGTHTSCSTSCDVVPPTASNAQHHPPHNSICTANNSRLWTSCMQQTAAS